MKGVDQLHVASSHHSVRKSIKWYKKLFFYLLDVCLVNSYLVHKELGGTKQFLSFRFTLVKEIFESQFPSLPTIQSRGRLYRLHGQKRLLGRHFRVELPPTEKRAKTYKRCMVCSRENIRKETRFICEICEVPLCAAPCFKVYHTFILVKNALRKKAFGSNATDEDRKAFRQAVKAHNYLKRMDDNKWKSRTSRHNEKQYHKNFWKFSKQCVNGNIGQSNVSPTFDANLANQYFPQKYSTPNPIVIDNLSWFPYLPVQLDARIGFNLDPVRPRDIRLILKNKKATSAPGPDGLMYGIFRKLPATHRFLATLFSKLLVTGDPPSSWSKSEVTLIHKAGDTDKPENFRMISLTSCVGKLFHQILSDQIANYFLRNKFIDPETQKAFLKGINGCMEHTFVIL